MNTIPNAFAETLKDVIEGSPLNQKELSIALGISAPHLSEMKNGKRSCTAEYDLRLSRFFGTSEGFWLRLQTAYQLRLAKAKKGEAIQREVIPASL
jgi:addiction module HigA family antidote